MVLHFIEANKEFKCTFHILKPNVVSISNAFIINGSPTSDCIKTGDHKKCNIIIYTTEKKRTNQATNRKQEKRIKEKKNVHPRI